jgi:glycosyltransferase involved in cell wall biosynthesis
MHQLAIIIPAYKPDFLFKALKSIEIQTDSRFQVYIGDDASPYDLENIIEPFVKKNGWIYKKFENNLGQSNLVGHWNRCVNLSSEPWLWLFSDDDELEKNCVSSFYKALEINKNSNVFKFNFSIINQHAEIIGTNKIDFSAIDGFEFGKRRFERTLLNSAVEFIFSRKAFEREEGFINFPSAWCSDDASWIAFSSPEKIAYIAEAKVFWRMSDINISSQAGSYVNTKLTAASDFINWFNKRYKARITPSLFGEQIIWFRLQIENLNYEISFFKAVMLSFQLNPPGLISWLRTFNEIFARSFVGIKARKEGLGNAGFKLWLSTVLPKF